jgi:hypothetical protein
MLFPNHPSQRGRFPRSIGHTRGAMTEFSELSLTRENAPEMLRELEAKRQSLSKNDPHLPKLIVQIAWVKGYLRALPSK